MSRINKLLCVLIVLSIASLACTAPTSDQMSQATDAANAQATLDAGRVTVAPTPTVAPTSVSGYALITLDNVASLRPVHTVAGMDAPIDHIAWSRDSRLVAVASENNVALIEAGSWNQLRAIATDASIAEVALSPNGFLMLTVPGSDGRTGMIWDTNTGQPARTEISLSGVTHAAWSLDGASLALSRAGGLIELIGMDSGRRTTSFSPREAAPDIPADMPSPVTGLWISPNGQQVAASIQSPAYLIVWQIGRELPVDVFDLKDESVGGQVRAFISPLWDQFVWITENTVVLAEMGTGANREALTFEDEVRGFGWSPSGQILAVATAATVDGDLVPAVRLIDANTAQELAVLTNNWSDIPSFVSFAPDGSMIAIPNGDGSLAIWAIQE